MVHTKTFYVDSLLGVACIQPNGLSPVCLFPLPGGPFLTVNQANSVACSGDRLFVRVGSYNEKVTFNRLMTVKSYGGTAVIGR